MIGKKAEAPKKAANSIVSDPYTNARREWNERYGDYIAQAKNWRVIAFMSILVALASVIGLGVSASQNKIQPYVVEVDGNGMARATGPAITASAVDQRVIKAYLGRFITDFRSVTTDLVFQKQMLNRVYAMIPQGSPTLGKVNDFYKANSPFDRAATGTVAVEITSVLPTTEKTWQVEWTESERDLSGSASGAKPKRFQASLQITVNPPQDARQIQVNPLGIFVPDLNWTQQL